MSNQFLIRQAWIVLALAVVFGCEHMAPYYIGRPRLWKHDATNAAIGLLNIGITTLLFSALTVYLTGLTSEMGFGLLRILVLPQPIQVILSILCLDLYMHRVHHSVRRVETDSN